MLFEQGVYVLEADREKTADFYRRYELGPGMGCGCTGCRNFEQAVKLLPGHFRDFLEQFGIDPAKPAEMSVACPAGPGAVLYDGWYHLCGSLLEGREPEEQTGPRSFRVKPEYILTLGEEGETALIREKRYLLPKGFPEPVLQVDVMFRLPWVLEEEWP